ncbi:MULTISPECIES: hypothetical protein [Myxococcus]|uniref:hypothetical protein n=1 Tax=Myxococcus TaxID=32 RepID=UPI00112BE6EA|nr:MULTISPECIES: hypothetical protein [Myxococcus]QDE86460.1 hypothetical protein BHS07_35730 [Myxococcus xanthus]QDF00620.1 hypothetical protein BHS05_34975 [Myxococcus xanthus]WAM26052.1 hypothetical protein OZ403_36915 [Myxococcus sp. NMCA1]
MYHHPTSKTCSSPKVTYAGRRCAHRWELLPALLLVAAVGCGPAEPMETASETLGTQSDELVSSNGLSTNGLSTNGLSTNGLSTNGLSTNGLSTNGLSTNGLSTNGFNTWFSADPVKAEEVMRYIVRCALASGQSLTYTHAGTTHTWQGSLGLAPTWSNPTPPPPSSPGAPVAPESEQQLVSSCLAAHVNKYGVHLNISVQGKDSQGTAIPTTAEELQTYNQNEAVFFGNLFNGQGLFAANDAPYLAYDESTVRACGLSSWSGDPDCAAVITHVGAAQTYCQQDSMRTYYARCTYNGVTYRPLTTRIRPQDIYKCGDGTCQLSESCGTSNTPDSCAADCGAC